MQRDVVDLHLRVGRLAAWKFPPKSLSGRNFHAASILAEMYSHASMYFRRIRPAKERGKVVNCTNLQAGTGIVRVEQETDLQHSC
jgi:hypothetical protein